MNKRKTIMQEQPATPARWPASNWSAYGLAAALAVALIAFLYPPAYLLGLTGSFQQGDSAQHVSGWLLFATDAWRFPLLFTQQIDPPAGLPIFRTDSIPLAALIVKPFVGLLPEGFHYFGLWHAGIRLGQALCAVYLVRALGARDLASAVAAAGFALLWPANLIRIEHTALGTHWLLLLALGHYFQSRRAAWSLPATTAAFALTTAAALLIHPYLMAMVLAIQLADVMDRAIKFRQWWQPALSFIATLVLLAVIAWPLGYLSVGNSARGGFDIYSMNALSPFCGGAYPLCVSPDATGGQYEGFNFLGLGVLIAVAVALLLDWGRIGTMIRSYPGLTAIMIGLVFYALSSRIWIGDFQLVSYSVPYPLTKLTETFRASGRFFWPVGLLVAVLAVSIIAARLRRWAPVLLVPLVVVQFVDQRPLLQALQSHASRPLRYDFDIWRAVFPDLAAVEVYPRYGCPGAGNDAYNFLQLLAGELGATINTAYLADNQTSCEAAIAQAPRAPGSATLVVSLAAEAGAPQPPAIRALQAQGLCRIVGVAEQKLMMCASADTDWPALGLPVEPVQPERL